MKTYLRLNRKSLGYSLQTLKRNNRFQESKVRESIKVKFYRLAGLSADISRTVLGSVPQWIPKMPQVCKSPNITLPLESQSQKEVLVIKIISNSSIYSSVKSQKRWLMLLWFWQLTNLAFLRLSKLWENPLLLQDLFPPVSYILDPNLSLIRSLPLWKRIS